MVFLSVFMVGNRTWRGQAPNEEVFYHKHSLQDVMIENLQRQVAKSMQLLAAQNLDMHCNIDDDDSESIFREPISQSCSSLGILRLG